MKTATMNLTMIAVVALTAAAGSASAQSLKAEIPMSFRAGSRQMAAGSYDFRIVTAASGQTHLVVRKADGSSAAILFPIPGTDAPKAAWLQEGKPKVAFDCVGNSCSLARLWDGQDAAMYSFPARKPAPAETERLTSITVTLTRAE